MILPLQITFRNMESSEAVKGWIQEAANKLEEFHGKITGCRVVVEQPNRRRKAGNHYHVRVDLTVPGGEVVVKRQANFRVLPGRLESRPTKRLEVKAPHKDLRQAINDAFDAMQRRLQDFFPPQAQGSEESSGAATRSSRQAVSRRRIRLS